MAGEPPAPASAGVAESFEDGFLRAYAEAEVASQNWESAMLLELTDQDTTEFSLPISPATKCMLLLPSSDDGSDGGRMTEGAGGGSGGNSSSGGSAGSGGGDTSRQTSAVAGADVALPVAASDASGINDRTLDKEANIGDTPNGRSHVMADDSGSSAASGQVPAAIAAHGGNGVSAGNGGSSALNGQGTIAAATDSESGLPASNGGSDLDARPSNGHATTAACGAVHDGDSCSENNGLIGHTAANATIAANGESGVPAGSSGGEISCASRARDGVLATNGGGEGAESSCVDRATNGVKAASEPAPKSDRDARLPESSSSNRSPVQLAREKHSAAALVAAAAAAVTAKTATLEGAGGGFRHQEPCGIANHDLVAPESPTPAAPAAAGSSALRGGSMGDSEWGTKPWQNFELIKKSVLASKGLRKKGAAAGSAASAANGLAEISDYDSDDEMARCQCKPKYPGARTCSDNGCINYATNTECPAGRCNPNCCNQNLQLRLWADVDVFYTGIAIKGHGLRVNVPLREGAFVIEYVGEVINAQELERRMQSEGQGTSRLYMMQLAHNQYLDAKRKGGIARFINHSCEPNCRLERWRAGRHLRCAVFAAKDLAPGDELSFDYQWASHRYRRKTKCLCGAPTCRGTLEVEDFGTAADPLGVGAGLGLDGKGWFRMPREEDVVDPAALVNRRVRIYWEGNFRYYAATVVEYLPEKDAHLVVYDGDDDALQQEKLTLESGEGDDGSSKWEIWEESQQSVVIARKEKEKASDSGSGTTDAETDSSEEGRRERERERQRRPAVERAKRPTTPVRPPPPFVPPRMMETHYFTALEAQTLLAGRAGLMHMIQARSGARLDIKNNDSSIKGAEHMRVLIITGGQAQVKMAVAMARERVTMFTAEDVRAAAAAKEAAAATSSSVTAGAAAKAAAPPPPPPRPRTRWCMGLDWGAFTLAELEAGLGRAAEMHKRNALRCVRQLCERASAPRELVLHAAVLLQRHLAIGPASAVTAAATGAASADAAGEAARRQQQQAARPDISVFPLATACVLLANKAMRARATPPLARPVKTPLLLGAAYGIQFPGRELSQTARDEAQRWEAKVLAAEGAVLRSLGFDVYFEDPLRAMRSRVAGGIAAAAAKASVAAAAEDPATADRLTEAAERRSLIAARGSDLMMEAALQGTGMWLRFPAEVVVAAASLVAAAVLLDRAAMEGHASSAAQAAGSLWPNVVACSLELAAAALAPLERPLAMGLLTEMQEWPRPNLEAKATAMMEASGGGSAKGMAKAVADIEAMARAPDVFATGRSISTRDIAAVERIGGESAAGGGLHRLLRACVAESYLRGAGLGMILDTTACLPRWSGEGGDKTAKGERLFEVSLLRWPGDGRRESGDVGISSVAVIELSILQRLHGPLGAGAGAPNLLLPLAVVCGEKLEARGNGASSAASPPPMFGRGRGTPEARSSPADTRGSSNPELPLRALAPLGSSSRSLGGGGGSSDGGTSSRSETVHRSSSVAGGGAVSLSETEAPVMAGKPSAELLRPNYLLMPPVAYTLPQVCRTCRQGAQDGIPLPAPLLRSIVREILLGASQCHAADFVLRGVDAANVLLSREGRVRIGGLGTASLAAQPPTPAVETSGEVDEAEGGQEARKLKAQEKLDHHIKREGDVQRPVLLYAAPEILLGRSGHTRATDLWSLGCLLAGLALGRPLFNGRGRQHHLQHIFKTCGTIGPDTWPEGKQLPFLAALEPLDAHGRPLHCRPRVTKALAQGGVDPELADVLCGLLELDPCKRWPLSKALAAPYFASGADEAGEAERREAWSEVRSKMEDGQFMPPPKPQRHGQPPPPTAVAAVASNGTSGTSLGSDDTAAISGSARRCGPQTASSRSHDGGGRSRERRSRSRRRSGSSGSRMSVDSGGGGSNSRSPMPRRSRNHGHSRRRSLSRSKRRELSRASERSQALERSRYRERSRDKESSRQGKYRDRGRSQGREGSRDRGRSQGRESSQDRGRCGGQGSSWKRSRGRSNSHGRRTSGRDRGDSRERSDSGGVLSKHDRNDRSRSRNGSRRSTRDASGRLRSSSPDRFPVRERSESREFSRGRGGYSRKRSRSRSTRRRRGSSSDRRRSPERSYSGGDHRGGRGANNVRSKSCGGGGGGRRRSGSRSSSRGRSPGVRSNGSDGGQDQSRKRKRSDTIRDKDLDRIYSTQSADRFRRER